MNLGSLDLCLRCHCVAESEAFYRKLGFEPVEGNSNEGWIVVQKDTVRLGLFEFRFMDGDSFSLNFRNGNIPALVEEIRAAGLELSSEAKFVGEAGGSIRLRDPDGHLLFFDSE